MSSRRTSFPRQGCGRQHGAALMVMLVILVVGVAAILVNSLTTASIQTARQKQTAAALAQAKAALIGYAVTYADTHSGQVPGYLPCPDYGGGNPEGSAEPVCGSQDASVIGRLPWATLDVSTLRDGDGECLWYAVSGTYKNNPKTGLMNWDTNGQFQVYTSDGTQLASQVVAVIFAPGAVVSGQNRTGTAAPICGGNYTASNYLDNDTVHGINNSNVATGNFIQGNSTGNVNDQMVFITRQDIWNAIQNRTDFQPRNPTNPSLPNFNNPLVNLTKQVALCLANYGNNNQPNDNYSLPWAAQLSLSDYSVDTNYNDTLYLLAGRVPYLVGTARSTTGNTLGNLMTTGSCGASWASVDPWWNNWKDHLFYAVSQTYRPTSYTDQYCGPCVHVNSSGNYAGVVMFAGPRLSTQTRANKSVITDYLESSNSNNISAGFTSSGNGNYTSSPASSMFNDTVCVINPNNYWTNQDLTVNCL